MLKKSDVPISEFVSFFAETNTSVAFLVPTETGYGKSIMDATMPVRELLKFAGVHDYESQGQGPENKVKIESYFVTEEDVKATSASLYRPNTKHGDPRIWFSDLKSYCQPYNLLALIIFDKAIYVINLSNPAIKKSLFEHGHVYSFLQLSLSEYVKTSEELLEKLRIIHKKGFIPSVTKGDPGVGDTLEHELGINRNNSKQPDYKGIELKCSRISTNGVTQQKTRCTLFTKVPTSGLTYAEILDRYGKVQTPKGAKEPRKQIYDTLTAKHYNAYGLKLEVDYEKDQVNIIDNATPEPNIVSSWDLTELRKTLLTKHHETFWIKAASLMKENWEYFRYDNVNITNHPNALLLGPLIENGEITADLAAHIKPDGSYRDHGLLFKMLPENIPHLLGLEKNIEL